MNKFISTLKVLYPYLWKRRIRLTGVVFLVLLVVGVDLAQPILVKEAIDRYIAVTNPNFGAILWIAVFYLMVVMLTFGLSYLQDIVLQSTGLSIVREIRLDLFRHILGLSVGYFDRNPSGRIITNVVSDTEALNTFFTDFLSATLRGVFTLVLIVLFMLKLDARIAGYCLLAIPAILVISVYFQVHLRRVNQEMRSRLSTVIAFLAENLSGMSVVQVFHQEKKQYRAFDDRNKALLTSTIQENRLTLLFFLFTEGLNDLGVSALVWFGGGAVLHGAISFGVLYAFVGYARRFFQPINTLTLQMNVFQSMLVASERIAATLRERQNIVEAPGAEAPVVRGGVQFEKATLAYRPGINVLKSVTLEVKPGERIGFVGASGAGKTSLMGLLARFYDATGGTVRIDGKDVREWPIEDLRRTVGIVQQDISLFSGSVLDNIRFFRTNVLRERVEEVCRFIGADAFIRKMPQGYDTVLSEKGATLSFGERQLLSFARALVFNPKILVLDEATASLDSESEVVLQEAVSKVAEGRTLLVIAHRLSTVQQMDSIVVLDDGVLVEKGRHEELLARNGRYASLHRSGTLALTALGV